MERGRGVEMIDYPSNDSFDVMAPESAGDETVKNDKFEASLVRCIELTTGKN